MNVSYRILCIATLVNGGCQRAESVETTSASTTPPNYAVQPLPDRDLGCPKNRQVSVSADETCSAPLPWQTSKLFGSSASGELGTYCLHTMDDTPSEANLAALPVNAKPDCNVPHRDEPRLGSEQRARF